MSQYYIKIIMAILVLLSTSMITGFAQEKKQTIDQAEKEVVIDSIAKLMFEKYVFPEVGKKMGDIIESNIKKGEYKDIIDPIEFADRLTKDLQSVSKDKHVGLRFMPEKIAMIKKADMDENSKELEDYEKVISEKNNFAFKEASILPGNVGYLKFNQFYDASCAGPTAIAALNFLAYTDALIIDLTDNGGGSPSLIQLMSSYFFEEPQHLNSFYIREGERTKQFWTLPHVPGKKMVDTDIYVLTSKYTFSGAEEFTYNLKNMERATIVGETTGGGAHPVTTYIINDNFIVRIPFGKAVNPISNTNWEGTGIEPDVKVPKSKAKETAYLLALQELLKDVEEDRAKFGFEWAIAGLKAKLDAPLIEEKIKQAYIGTYGPRTISMENGELFYQREGRAKWKMIPLNENTFMFDEIDYFRLQVLQKNGKVTGVKGMYDNGRTDENGKS